MAKKRLLQVITRSDWTGAQKVLYALVYGLKQYYPEEFEVEVACGKSGDILVQKVPAARVGDLAQAIKELFEADNEIKIIGIRHGERMHEILLIKEERMIAEDLSNFFRGPADTRDLNYDKYFVKGELRIENDKPYASNNTTISNIEQIKEKLLSLVYIQEELAEYKKEKGRIVQIEKFV